MVRHQDFEKIFQAFIKRYGQVEGEKNYYAWLSKMNLDDTKSYSRPQESFAWAKNLFSFLREDYSRKYFKVEASFPLSSMNNYVYTEDELLRGARSLVGKPVNLNHSSSKLDSVSIEGAEYEDGAVECVLGFLKGSDVLGMVEKGEIVHVSTEANCSQGIGDTADGSVCMGLVYTGLALLTKDVLPGVPLTRIMPVESIVESFQVMVNGGEKLSENDKVKTEGKCKCPKCGSGNVNEVIASGENTEQGKAQGFKDLDLYPIKPCVEFECEDCKHRWPNPEFLKWKDEHPITEEKKSPCEEAKEALLVRLTTLEGKVHAIEAVDAKELKEFEEKAAAEKKAAEAKRNERPSVLTKEGFWARFHELRKDGCNKTDAFRLVSMEVIEASTKQ